MKNLFLVLTVILFSTTFVAAQKWYPGYIITQRGDTTQGEIKFNKNLLYNEIEFKTEEGGVRNFSPEQLRGYSFNNRHFTRNERVSNIVFVEKKVDGYADLYETNLFVRVGTTNPPSGYKVNYFVKKEDGDFIPITKSDFKDTMYMFVNDSNDLRKKIKDKKLKYKHLAQIIEEYNSWYTANNK